MKKQLFAVCTLCCVCKVYSQYSSTDSTSTKAIETVELFGIVKKQPKGLEVITRLPLHPREQIQSISVVSSKVIEDLGGLTVTDVAKNVAGVTRFSSYGGTKESMSVRGYRAVPVLKNGVLLDSDFRTGSMLSDMQGVESMQIIKGSAAVTQGIGDGLGAAGGVINLVTKTPQFINAGTVGFRAGSWDFYRPTIDIQRVLDKQRRVAVRLDGAYQNANSFRKYVKNERIYINPSIAFRPDDKTSIVVEMDYLNDDQTPDRGTVNLATGDINALYKMPKGKFLGFSADNNHVEAFNFMTAVDRQLNDKLQLRAAYIHSNYSSDNVGAALQPLDKKKPNEFRRRSLSKSYKEDINRVFQFDFIGQNVLTGPLKHTFQVGVDWKQTDVETHSFEAKDVDIINVLQDIPNALPANIGKDFVGAGIVNTVAPTLGLMAQDVITVNKYVKAHLGLRYSHINGLTEGESSAWNPSAGLMISPMENVNLFGSYTTTTSLRTANNPLLDGGVVGPSTSSQWEAGIKSDWLGERLRFNVTYFDIKADNLSYSVLDANGNNTGYYGLAGNLRRKGVEVDLIGRILPNLQVMTGYSYLDAQYHDSPAYMDGSAPMNAPKHTANGWLNYKFMEGALRGLDLGAGVYFVGEKPVDDYTKKTFMNGHANSVQPGVKPFMMDAYTTVDAQLGYSFGNASVRVFANNLFNALGYTSYFRGGYVDQIQPRNFAVQLNYRF